MARGGARAHVNIDRTVDSPQGAPAAPDTGLFAGLATPLLCIDGNNLLWRAAHGRPAPFPATDGRDLTPIFRFFVHLRRVLGAYGVFAECVVCFDGEKAWEERLGLYSDYKSNRSYEGADLSFMGWIPEIRAALEAGGVRHTELADQEADDVIATLAKRAGDRPVRILSTDRDYFQLISSTTVVINPRSRPPLVNAEAVVQRYRVQPDQWCDFRALAGDPSDGIPGVRGVGPKRAAALLEGGRRLEHILDDLDAGSRDDVLRWRNLIRLRTDVPLDFELQGRPTATLPSAAVVCRQLGLA